MVGVCVGGLEPGGLVNSFSNQSKPLRGSLNLVLKHGEEHQLSFFLSFPAVPEGYPETKAFQNGNPTLEDQQLKRPSRFEQLSLSNPNAMAWKATDGVFLAAHYI